jgi:hypothetical protein
VPLLSKADAKVERVLIPCKLFLKKLQNKIPLKAHKKGLF